ncbi:MAG: ATP-binding protein [Syntrophobacteraceae bacterium]|jgi:PAS domain S-box-containing protein
MEHGSINVLLIEDNPADARFIAEIIRTGRHASKFDLIHKSRLRDALQYLKESERPVDAILLDLSLPDSQGFDTFLRLLTEASDLPIIVLTGIDDETVATRAVQEGAQDYLVKGQVDGPLLSRSILYAIERKRTEKDLQKQAALLNLAHDAIFVRGPDHTVQFWNDGAVELYGFTREEALGKVTQDLLHTVFPEPIDRIVTRVIQTGRWEGELRQTTRTGEKILVESCWALQPGKDGMPLGFLEINRDVTAKKLADEALRSNMARLELVNAELQEFAYVASHDLQEPLRKIQTFCDMAQKRCAPALDSAMQSYLGRIISSAGRMRQLLDDLLQFARVATKPEPFKVIDLGEIVREAADVFEETLRDTGALVEVENLPNIEADETQILRLFQNLIGNALKFRGDRKLRIIVFAKQKGRGVCEIFVKDNGMGFEQQFAERIFKPFQRLHGRGEYDGTGMGLAICRKIVERHGGSIRAESEPGKGSTFIVRLPVKQDRWESI